MVRSSGLRIGIDGRVLTRRRTGIGRYLISLVASLQGIDASNQYIVYVHKPIDNPFAVAPNWQFKVISQSFPFSVGFVWLNTIIPRHLREDAIDVFWGPEQLLPLAGVGQTKLVLTVHDLVSYVYPETQTVTSRIIGQTLVKHSIRKADKIIAVSASTKRDLERVLSVPERRITTIHEGVDATLMGLHDAAKLPTGLVAGKYVLFVGTFEPRKNLSRLVRAYKCLPSEVRNRYPLVLAGAKGWKSRRLPQLIRSLELGDQTMVMEQISDGLLSCLYANATVFVFPSLYEGFGLPVLEALATGCTVITSRASSLPEVGGSLAYYIDPENVEELTACLADVLAGRRPLVGRADAMNWAAQFSWVRAAAQTLDVLRAAASC